jgi:hypothetical protein
VAALDRLESLGLVKCSLVRQDVRLYKFTVPADPAPGDAFGRLRSLVDSRAGRLLLAKRLRRHDPPSEGGAPGW